MNKLTPDNFILSRKDCMNRVRPYLNRFVKQKEQDIEDSYHSINLKEMKPVTCKHMNHNETILINNSKREMIKQVRDIEIERENKVLLQKISTVMSKKGSYSVGKNKNIRTKVNKSLNQFYRKRQMEEIQIENKRFVQRLQQKKPTLNMEKIGRDWADNKDVIKRMANFQFNLTSIKSSSRVRSITSQKFYKTMYEKTKITKFKNIDGQKMLIKIEFTNDILKITGDSQNSKELKVIEIPKGEAIVFIEKDCNGKVENIADKLKYDAPTQTLYLVSDHLEEEDQEGNQFNPEIDKFVSKKKEEVQKKEGKHVKSKESVESGKANKSEISKKGDKKKKKSQEPENKNISVLEEKKEPSQKELSQKEPSQKASEKKIQPQEPLEKETPVEEPKSEGIKQSAKEEKPESVKAEKEQKVVESSKQAIEPQEEKYEEQNFEESANISPEEKKKSEPKAEAEVAESKPIEEIKEEQKKQEAEKKPEVIVAPEEAGDYNEENQASAQIKKEVEEEKPKQQAEK